MHVTTATSRVVKSHHEKSSPFTIFYALLDKRYVIDGTETRRAIFM